MMKKGHMEEESDVGQASTSSLRATPSQQARRLQQRKSRSPYPKGSPRTPVRRLADESFNTSLSIRSTPVKSPQSPSMRALSSIVSLLTPFGSRQAKTSAAFGDPEPDEEENEEDDNDGEEHDMEAEQSTLEISGLDDSLEVQESIYPPLPSEPINLAITAPPVTNTSTLQDDTIDKPTPRRSLLTSAFTAPRHSTPSKTGFGALAASAPQSALPPSAPSFTFGRSNLAESSTSYLPPYPRQSTRQHLSSPLAKNYDLLARFFAEKAEQEARGEEAASSAASLMGGEMGGEDGGLTEIEVAGCMRLIEESLAQGKSGELERLRGDALERASLGPVTPSYMDESRYNRGYMSRSPSLPLGAAAGEMPVGYGLQSRPSSSVSGGEVCNRETKRRSLFYLLYQFLSPAYQRSDDADVNKSLATTFGTATAPVKRRHRPLYLGPGQGAGAATSLLRRNQQAQRRSLQNRPLLPSRTPVVPSWQREEVNEEDRDASGSHMKRRKIVNQEAEEQAQQPNSTSASSTLALPTFSYNPPPPTAISPPAASRQDEVAIATPRTATADAMLSILSSGPSIPIRRSMPSTNKEAASNQDTPLARTDIVNPYQTRSRLSKRASVGVGSSSLGAKEKERLKEEREKRQKAVEEAKKKSKESTLEMIERTAPMAGSKRGARRIRIDEEDDEQVNGVLERKKEEEKEKARRKEEEEARQAEVEQSRKRRQGEAVEDQKRRLYEQEEKLKLQREADEERRRKTEEVKKRMEKLASTASTTTSSSSSSAAPAPEPVAAPVSTSLNAPRKSFTSASSFAPKKPSPLSQGNILAPDSPSSSSEVSEREYIKQPFVFASPSTNGSKAIDLVPAKSTPIPSLPQSKETAKEPRQQAIDLPSTSLPKFDFSMNVVLPTSSTVVETDEEARKIAKQTAVGDLPTFDFVKGAGLLSTATSTSPSTFSFGASTPAPKTAEVQQTETATTAAVETTTTEGKASDSSSSNNNNVSALLSGTGEGEEEEDCLHQVRCKVWNLKEGKWVDLGIGLFKVKKHKGDGKKRILVRNEGNGKVMVNFRLMAGFKPIKDKNIVSFLGFDGEGKPTNYRCKIKTNESADELAGVLEREAV